MKRLCLFATAAAALTLISAAPPGREGSAPADYPRCSATVTDNCIQRMREPESRALDAMPSEGAEPARRTARGGPYERPPAGVMRHYPPCSATVTDRCQQGARHYRRPAARAHRVRRAGERG